MRLAYLVEDQSNPVEQRRSTTRDAVGVEMNRMVRVLKLFSELTIEEQRLAFNAIRYSAFEDFENKFPTFAGEPVNIKWLVFVCELGARYWMNLARQLSLAGQSFSEDEASAFDVASRIPRLLPHSSECRTLLETRNRFLPVATMPSNS